MENSFNAMYQKTAAVDGSIALSFAETRFYPQALANAFLLFSIFFVLPVSCTGSILLQDKPNPSVALVPALLIGAVLVVFFWLIFIKRALTTIKIYPDVGVEFQGKSLPFDDIEAMGITTKSNGTKTWAYVFANSGGQEIPLTKWMDEPLARSLQQQIMAESSRFG